jgi:hypothetical protein
LHIQAFIREGEDHVVADLAVRTSSAIVLIGRTGSVRDLSIVHTDRNAAGRECDIADDLVFDAEEIVSLGSTIQGIRSADPAQGLARILALLDQFDSVKPGRTICAHDRRDNAISEVGTNQTTIALG